jgi:hypothetical protein
MPLKTAGLIHNDRLMLIAEIRLYANNGTPTIYARAGFSTVPQSDFEFSLATR